MSKAALIIALTMVLSLFATARAPQDDEKPPDPETLRQEIVNLENEAAHAMQLENATFFHRVYGDDYRGISSRGQLVDKNMTLQAVQGSSFKYEAFEVKDVKVRLFGSTAVATALWNIHGRFLGRTINAEIRTMHIYVNGRRGWQVVAGEETPVQ